ncbi:brother of CDO isoform X3 [Ictalurus punctatus]|uniref:Brother of CDO isoform X3 n=1 Tax=Ictalurus punctatus TaxID=7998 RepID=A0A2D0PS11_ICTPU|nr:brother of CDO isoform X3 [Ictalurus punctatus]
MLSSRKRGIWKMSRMADRISWHGRLQVLCALCSALLCCLQAASPLSDDDVPVFTEEPLSVVQKLGGSVTLRCSARPAQARISWRLNGRELFADGDEAELGVATQPDALFIPSLSNGTLGRYQCVASTGAGARASMPANVTAAKLRDFEPDDQQEIEVDEGNTAVIECHLPESQPQAQVRYSVKQEWLETSKGNYLIMPSGNLQIANATQEDEGPYKCAAYNPVTQEIKTSSSTDRLRIRRSTSEAARIIYPPASRTMTVRKGHRLVLECVASGTPTPQVTWAKDGRELSPQNNTRFLLSNLLIDAVSERDSGTYACHAHNGMGSPGTATVLYDVQVIEPPQVRVELLQQEPAWGDTVRFSCQVRGNPAPSVVWLHNAQPITPSSRHRLSSHVLRVYGVGPQDDGVYQCMAENWVGGAQAATRLLTVPAAPSRPGRLPLIRPLSPDQVLRELPPARPMPPSTELLIDCSEIPGNVSPAEAPVILSQPRTGTADYYELVWEPRHDGGAPVLEYVVKYRKAGETLGEWTIKNISGLEHKLILAKLQPASLYEVEMAARNCAGLGQPAMMTFRTGRKSAVGTIDRPKTPVSPPRLSPPEAPDRPTVTTASETSAYVTWIPRGNRGFPIQCFRVEFKKLRKDGGAGGEWEVAEDNISPSRLSVQIKGLEKGTSYKFRVLAVNVLGASPPSAPSKAYTVMGSNQTNPRPVDGPYITYSEAINETTIILKWTYTPLNNTPIYGFYIYYRPTDSDNDSDYKRDVVEGDRYWHAITGLQPETAYDIKMQCFNEGGVSEFGNVVILETKARPNQKHTTPETSSHLPDSGGPVPRPSDLPYLIVGVVVLGALVFIIVAFVPFCLWRAWAKQKQTADMCFPAVSAPLSSCQYTMVPMQGMALVGHCPVDSHLTPSHTVYASKGEYTANGKHHTLRLPGLCQEDADCEMENGTFLPQRLSNGHAHAYHYTVGVPGHVEEDGCCEPDDSTVELLSPDHLEHVQENHATQCLADLSLLPASEAVGMTTSQQEVVKIQREIQLEERVLHDG